MPLLNPEIIQNLLVQNVWNKVLGIPTNVDFPFDFS